MRTKYAIAVSSLLILASAAVSAQQFKTGFFLDNYQYGYRINPAITPEKSHLGILLTNISAAPSSSIGVSDILFPKADGSLMTGFNGAVPSSTFLSGLCQGSMLGADVSENILAVGIRKNRSFGSFEVNARAIADVSLPYDMFAMLKNGTSDEAYDLSGLGADAKVYLEVAYGKAFIINDKFTVGARLKALFGLGSIGFDAGNAKANLQDGLIGMEANASVRMSSKYLSYSTLEGTDIFDPESIEFNAAFYGPTGYGAALDLGLTFKPFKGLTLSAAVQDLGAVHWDYNMVALSEASANFKGVDDLDLMGEGASSISDELEAQLESLGGLADFHVQNGPQAGWESLPFSANAGARYSFAKDILSVGALASMRHTEYLTSYDLRGGLTIRPLKWFSLAGTVGTGTYGNSCGAGISINVLTFNFHAGVDGYLGKTGKFMLDSPVAGFDAIPVPLGKFDCRLNLGLTLTFGERH